MVLHSPIDLSEHGEGLISLRKYCLCLVLKLFVEKFMAIFWIKIIFILYMHLLVLLLSQVHKLTLSQTSPGFYVSAVEIF